MRYQIEITEAAEAEIDETYRYLLLRDPEIAARWHATILKGVDSLKDMPTRCSPAPDGSVFEGDIRHHICSFGRVKYRIIFKIIPDEDQPVVRILRVRHGARKPLGESET